MMGELFVDGLVIGGLAMFYLGIYLVWKLIRSGE